MKYEVQLLKGVTFEVESGKYSYKVLPRESTVLVKTIDDRGRATETKYGFVDREEIYSLIETQQKINLNQCYMAGFSIKEYKAKMNLINELKVLIDLDGGIDTFFDTVYSFERAHGRELFSKKLISNYNEDESITADFSYVCLENDNSEVNFSNAQFGDGEVNFSNAQFGDGNVDFSDAQFGDGGVNFSNAQFGDGEVNFYNAQFGDGGVNFSDAQLGDGEVNFYNAQFGDGNVDFSDAQFGDGGVNFSNAQFGDGEVNFSNAQFGDGGVNFYNAQLGDGEVNFSNAQFGDGEVDFSNAQFGDGEVNFYNAQFGDGEVNFSNAQIGDGEVDFSNAQFGGGEVNFSNAQFGDGKVNFLEAQFGDGKVNFSNAQFGDGEVDFSNAQFGDGNVNFSDAQFGDGNVYFFIAQFGDGNVYFSDAQFGDGEVNFSNAQFGDGKVVFTRTQFGDGEVDFHHVRFGEGDVGFTRILGETVIFNDCCFRGHVNLENAKCKNLIIKNCLIEKTLSLKGMEVLTLSLQDTKNLGQIFVKWKEDKIEERLKSDTSQNLTDQFVMLKENFHTIGRYEDEDMAYVKYKRCEWKSKYDELCNGKVYWIPMHYIKKLAFDTISEYATNYKRVAFCMIILWAVFTIFCFIPGQLCKSGVDYSVGYIPEIREGISYSIATFLTIGYGNITPSTSFAVFLSGLEGFSGVFLIAYFTVAFARKALR